MAVEVALYPTGLNPAAPTGGDKLYEADDVFRLLKTVLVNTFPNISGPVTLTPAQLNALLRAPLVPSAETAFAFPSIATRSGKLFAFDGSGNPDVTRTLTAFDADVANTAAAQAAAAGSAAASASSASASAGYATTSQGYATASMGYRDTANLWATSLSLVDGTYYGARKYAIDAAASAAAAAGSAVGVLPIVHISTNTAGALGNLYIFDAPCTLTLPTTTDATKKIGWCNASQSATGCFVDFGTSKLKGFPTSPGVMTLDSTTQAATLQWSGNSTTGWAQA